MARVRISRQGFITGKLSLEAQANTEAEVYNFGLDMCENFALKTLGGAFKRSGTQFLRFFTGKYSDGQNVTKIFDLEDREHIGFYAFYYEGEKILIFISSGKYVKLEDGPGNLGDPEYCSVIGYMREDGHYSASLINLSYTDPHIAAVYSGYAVIQTKEDVDAISCFSSANEFYVIIPKCQFEYCNYGAWNQNTPGFIDYSAFLKLNFNSDYSYSIEAAHWDSEPLFPAKDGLQLLIGCYSEVTQLEGAPHTAGTWPWDGDYSQLRLYAQIVDRAGFRYNNARISGKDRVDSEDLSYLNGMNVFFKFLKTKLNEGDRTDAYADRLPPGVYWVGGKINVIKNENTLKRNKQDIYFDFTIDLKNPEQAALFPIINFINDGAEENYPANVRYFMVWCYSERIARSNLGEYAVTDQYPWDGRQQNLSLYAKAYDSADREINNVQTDNTGGRTNGFDFKHNGYDDNYIIEGTVLKSDIFVDDRTPAHSDEYPIGEYDVKFSVKAISNEVWADNRIFNRQNRYFDFIQYNKDVVPAPNLWKILPVTPIVDGSEWNRDVTPGSAFKVYKTGALRNVNRNNLNSISDFFYSAFNKNDQQGNKQLGFLKEYPRNVVAYKGRTYIFFSSWIFVSRSGKSPTDFAMGSEIDYGFTIGWGDGKVGKVNWVIPAAKLIVGTSSGIYYTDSIVKATSDGGRELVPPELISNIPSNSTFPVLSGNSIVFVGADDTTLFEINLVGENGISISKINSHCNGMFTQKIVTLCYSSDYLWAIGEYGQCNVCCFATSGFTRRWFSYSFAGRYVKLSQMFAFPKSKIIASFKRNLLIHNSDSLTEVSTIEEVKPLFDVYRSKISEQFFLDFATARHSREPILEISNGDPFSYLFGILGGDPLTDRWERFFSIINDMNYAPVLFYFRDKTYGSFSYFGGNDMNTGIFVDSDNLKEDGFLIVPFNYKNGADFDDRTTYGQPIISSQVNVACLPFFDAGISDYMFFKEEITDEDGNVEEIQLLRLNFNKRIEISDEYLGVIFGIAELNDRIFYMKKTRDISGQFFEFSVEACDGLDPFDFFEYSSVVDNEKKVEHTFYLSPYGKDYVNSSVMTVESGTLAQLQMNDINLSLVSKVLIDDVVGAVGYNENIYSLEKVPEIEEADIYNIYWKSKFIKYNGFEFPAQLYGGFYYTEKNKETGDDEPKWGSPEIGAYCAENGPYSKVQGLGNVYFYMNYFKRDEIKHLLGESCQITSDGNQAWLEIDGEIVPEFVLTENLFRVLREPTFKPDGTPEDPGDPTLVLFLPPKCFGIYIVIGINYRSELQTVGLEGGCLFGTSDGTAGISRDAFLTVLYSRGGIYGNNPDENEEDLYPLRYDSQHSSQGDMDFIKNKNLKTASFDTALLADKNNTVRAMYIRHDLPCNFALLNIVQDVKVSDG
jgi:hypothetical protein